MYGHRSTGHLIVKIGESLLNGKIERKWKMILNRFQLYSKIS